MIVRCYLALSCLLIWKSGDGFPLGPLEDKKVPPSQVLDFMKKYGYIEEDSGASSALYTEKGIADTIKTVQRFGAIEQTGVLDNATLTLMRSPRCGVPDVIRNRRSKRYLFGSGGWNKRTISYFLANWSPRLDEHTVLKNIQLVLDTWGKYGRLTFRRSSTPDADIIVAFGRGYHGDHYPFDGPGQILAHAFFPYEESDFGGDIHFDDDEKWVDRRSTGGGDEDGGMDFFTVALHELGHSLGIAHSDVPNSVMFPYYRGYDPNTQFQLGYDDILAMYELYIRRPIKDDNNNDPRFDEDDRQSTTTTTTERYYATETTTTIYQTTPTPFPESTTVWNSSTVLYEGDDESVIDHKNHDGRHGIPPTNSPSLPYICNGKFDAVATLREELFIFKEQYVWRLKEMGKILDGYPVPIYQMFPQLPEDIKEIDAAYERPDGMIVLFTGNKFWVYDGKAFVENSPRPLSDYGLPASLDKIDAVQIWARNGKTYLYKQDRFWRYNETSKVMDPGYPMHMERWRRVPENLDAATTWKGVTYFFKDELYWKFDNDWIIATSKSPLPSPQLWLGCPEDEHNMRRLYNYEHENDY